MSNSPNILVLGYNAWDINLPVRSFPAADSKNEVGDILHGGGGPGATAAVAMARLGATIRLITQFGDDLTSRAQQDELRRAGVDTSLSSVAKGYESAKAVILVNPDNGDRTIFWTRGDLPALAPADMDGQWLQGADLFYTDGHDAPAATILAGQARAMSIPVVMDAGSVREGSAALVRQVSDAISSEGFAPDLTGCALPVAALQELRRRGPARVAMTFGRRGALALDQERVIHVPAFDVAVVDSTGAGDAFHAGYAYGRVTGLGFRSCLEYGAAVAALKCGHRGGRRGLPKRTEVAQLLQTGVRLRVPEEFAALIS